MGNTGPESTGPSAAPATGEAGLRPAGAGGGQGRQVPDVRLEGVVKRFDGASAVDGISVEVPRGSFFALLGPSGCGKTTTLRMIGGFEEPDEGRILLGDQDVVGLPPYKRDVNTVFQSYALFPHMSIEDNVAFGLERKGVPKGELKGRVAEMLELRRLAGGWPARGTH